MSQVAKVAPPRGAAQRSGRSWRCQYLVHRSRSLGLLNGTRVVLIANDAPAIETTTGPQQMRRRKPTKTGLGVGGC